jgi:hypothetical protein
MLHLPVDVGVGMGMDAHLNVHQWMWMCTSQWMCISHRHHGGAAGSSEFPCGDGDIPKVSSRSRVCFESQRPQLKDCPDCKKGRDLSGVSPLAGNLSHSIR